MYAADKEEATTVPSWLILDARDPTLLNPNLAPLDKGPFSAVPVHPGDIGTKGGPAMTFSWAAVNDIAAAVG